MQQLELSAAVEIVLFDADAFLGECFRERGIGALREGGVGEDGDAADFLWVERRDEIFDPPVDASPVDGRAEEEEIGLLSYGSVDRQRLCVSGGDGVGEPFRVARLGEITYLCFPFRCLAFLSLILDDAAAAEDSALFGRFISYGFIIFDKIDFVKYNFEKIIDEKILGF